MKKRLIDKIHNLYTLGPEGTNCEAAAQEWFSRQGRCGEIHLCASLEKGVEAIAGDPTAGLLGCIVYPKLHTLVFSNLKRMILVDCFVFPTLNMVLASKDGFPPKSVSTHPAPEQLVPHWVEEKRFVNSNSQAALDCKNGITDGCVTNLASALAHNLEVMENFGSISMGFTIHANIGKGVE